MDSLFILNDEARARFLQNLAQALGCTYICLWSYYPASSNRLFSIAGWWSNEGRDQSSSLSPCPVKRLFETYRQTLHIVDSGYVPGTAFKDGVPYIELKVSELLYRASTDIQRHFYQEAGIKTVVFAGCKFGEIEIGMSTVNHINLEIELKKWFPNENWPSSSSSSLRTVSLDSSEYSSLLFDVNPGTSDIPEVPIDMQQAIFRPTSISFQPQDQQTMQSCSERFYSTFPNMQTYHDTLMAQAMMTVMSSNSSPASSSHQGQQGKAANLNINQEKGAFKKYIYLPGLNDQMKRNARSQNMFKRSVTILRQINLRAMKIHALESRPASMQLHHKMSERKRREKLNESFEGLRSLLPPTTKKDKASLLSHTKDYLGTLQREIFELRETNQSLKSRLLQVKEINTGESSTSASEKETTEIIEASESISDERNVTLRLTVRRDRDILDLIINILEFLKLTKDTTLVFLEADNQSSSFNRVQLRLTIKGGDWDKLAFQEAIEKILTDVGTKTR